MRMYKKKNESTAFLNLILPYACVLLIPMLVWLLSNAYVVNTNEKKVISLVSSNVENSIGVVDSNLDQIENLVLRISQNSAFDDFYEKDELLYSEKMNLQSILSSYHIENGLINDVFMYSRKTDMIINLSSVFLEPEEYYKFSGGFESQEARRWAQASKEGTWDVGYSAEVEHKNSANSIGGILPYIRTMPIEYPSKKEGAIGVLINKTKLLESFDDLLNAGEGEIYVYNGKGEPVMSKGEKYKEMSYEKHSENGYKRVKSDGEKLHKFTYRSPKNQWQYNIFIKSSYVLHDMVLVNNVLNIVNILTFILGMFLCIYFTYGRNKSYQNIMRTLGIKNEDFSFKRIKSNEFDFLTPYLGDLLDENKKIKESMEKLSLADKHKFFHLLLTGTQTSEETARKLSEEYKVYFGGSKFTVLVLKTTAMYNIDGINNKNIFLEQVLSEYISEDFYLYIADAKTTVAIINTDMDDAEFCIMLRNKMIKMNLEVFYRYRSKFVIGIGGMTDKLSKIHNSYDEALEVVFYNKLTDSKNILFHSELPKEQFMYYYPIELENRFIKAVSSAKAEEALKVVDIIYDSNFKGRTLTAERIVELFGEISSSLNKIRHMYFSDEERIDYHLSDFTIKSFFEYVKDFIFSACENMKVFDEGAYNARFKEMLEYINENYSNNELSLTSLAEHFKISDITHISKSFKKFMNENFSSYLERIRMDKACEMLMGNMQVKEVSEKVGYLSDVSFRRAFKKRMGLSPSDYIKDMQRK